MNILTLDPGTRGAGVALYSKNKLKACAYIKNPVKTGDDPSTLAQLALEIWKWFAENGEVLNKIVVEVPRIYTAGKMKGDPNDLIPIAGLAYQLAVIMNVPCVRYYPHEWKGQVDPYTMCKRIVSKLDPAETGVLLKAYEKTAVALQHNMEDAIGIGLKFCGRIHAKSIVYE